MELGLSAAGSSWLERMLALRDRDGPFRLAYLEALLRVADWRASAKEREGDG
jgi:CRISPR-associated endonuclease/helicase Cas3